MKYNYNSWPYKVLGKWREMGTFWAPYPSVYDFIDPNWNPPYRDRIINYLRTAKVISVTSKLQSPCVIDDDDINITLCHCTDGVWEWYDDLAHYVEVHSVRLPDAFVEHMLSLDFTPPVLNLEHVLSLKIEEPPLLLIPNEGNQGLLLRKSRGRDFPGKGPASTRKPTIPGE